ncbi:MAG: transcriptional regulator [Mesorhizobium amorphae]|nr:MAG: transcriptional regulator [Mesorhizobium amorphae]
MKKSFDQSAAEAKAQDAVVAHGGEGVDASDEFVRIGDMASTFGVSLRTLRFYEDKGLLTPKREGNTRLYTRRDRARMKLIMMGRRIGFSLRDVKQIIDLYDPSGTNAKQLRMALDKSEKQLSRLHKQREETEAAIVEAGELIDTIRSKIAARAAAAA